MTTDSIQLNATFLHTRTQLLSACIVHFVPELMFVPFCHCSSSSVVFNIVHFLYMYIFAVVIFAPQNATTPSIDWMHTENKAAAVITISESHNKIWFCKQHRTARHSSWYIYIYLEEKQNAYAAMTSETTTIKILDKAESKIYFQKMTSIYIKIWKWFKR